MSKTIKSPGEALNVLISLIEGCDSAKKLVLLKGIGKIMSGAEMDETDWETKHNLLVKENEKLKEKNAVLEKQVLDLQSIIKRFKIQIEEVNKNFKIINERDDKFSKLVEKLKLQLKMYESFEKEEEEFMRSMTNILK
tara:strand:- start:592 stop:1005 length:414 start_codon:yes stop_codon:yes gene_type:complete